MELFNYIMSAGYLFHAPSAPSDIFSEKSKIAS